jgi:hypothetical protein
VAVAVLAELERYKWQNVFKMAKMEKVGESGKEVVAVAWAVAWGVAVAGWQWCQSTGQIKAVRMVVVRAWQ